MTWPTIYVQAAFGEDPRASSIAHAYVDLASRCLELTINSPKRDRLLERFGSGSIVARFDNADGDLDPTNLSGTYVSGGQTQIVPNLPLRVYANYSGTDYYLSICFRDSGRVESSYPEWSEATWQASDAFKLLGRINRSAVASVGDGETTGDRIDRILDSAGWNSHDRDVATGLTRVIGTTLEGNVLDELGLTVDAEGGDLYIAGNGAVTFRDRAYRTTTTTWELDDTTSTEHTSTSVVDDDEQLINWASVSRVGGTEQVAEDTASQSRYSFASSPRWSRTNQIMTTEAGAKAIADMAVGLRSDTVIRFEAVTLNPSVNDNLWPMVLGMQIGDKVEITDTPVGGSAVTRTCFIEGWTHNIRGVNDSVGEWTTTVYLSDASSVVAFGAAPVWDAAEWDVDSWFY